MCLAIVALHAHPHYPLVIAANRDEFHARPAAPAAWWNTPPGMFAGRDLSGGGTWLGVTTSGRWAFVTNVREAGRHDPARPTRGILVPAFLGDPRGVDAALRDLEAGAARYNGFNLLAGDRLKASWMSNRVPGIHRLVHGVHGVSNARLDTPWPKLTRVKAGVAAWSRAGSEDIGALFDLLGDRALAPEAELPSTGVPPDWERVLSAPFIVSGRYGTRCSTVVTIDAESRLRFLERSFDADGRFVGEVDESFSVATATA